MGDMLSVFKMKKTRTQPLFYERGWKMVSKKKSQMCFTDGGEVEGILHWEIIRTGTISSSFFSTDSFGAF